MPARWLLVASLMTLAIALPGEALDGPRQGPSGQALSAGAKQVLAWLPGERSATGWKRAKPPQVFGADNLWEFIDGAADTYVTYGFEELVSVTCADPQLGAEATIDVYRMATTAAYTVLSHRAPPMRASRVAPRAFSAGRSS